MISKHTAMAFFPVAMCSLLWSAQANQQTFPSAMEAAESLFQAVQSNDVESIAHILGDEKGLTSCDDEVQDRAERELFVRKYKEMHRLHRMGASSMTLYLGAENWPFPVPLVLAEGRWRFDVDAGMRETLVRRIGENEQIALDLSHEFAVQGKATDGALADLVAKIASSAGHAVMFHGYYFVEPGPPGPGALALVAYPAEYRSSGVMTFVVTPNGRVLEKDLGSTTPAMATELKTAQQSRKWRSAEE